MIVVVDYETVNLKSVANAVDLLGYDVCVSSQKSNLEHAKKIILPGVGSFTEGMNNLTKLGLIEPLRQKVVEQQTPFLGICLGMQMLATVGDEYGGGKGLNFIPGQVIRFELADPSLKIPHVGWDDINLKSDCPLFQGIKKDLVLYFVHSYHFIPNSDEYVIATCNYGGEFVACLQKYNIFATQFHPEKSQEIGLKILENFLEWKP